jgi:hypothetical protein
LSHNIRQDVGCSETNENMRMISGTSYGRGDCIHVFNDSADVCVEIVAPRISNHAAPAFCAENNVVMETEVG